MAKEKSIDGHIDISYTTVLADLKFRKTILSHIPSEKVPYNYGELPWYNEHNSAFHNIPEYVPDDLKDICNTMASMFFPGGRYGWTIDCINPGNTVLEHVDMLKDLHEKYPEEKDFIRYALLLQDRQPGQFIEVNDEPIIDWAMGDYIKLRGKDWEHHVDQDWHMATNGGLHPMYVMVISGPVGG